MKTRCAVNMIVVVILLAAFGALAIFGLNIGALEIKPLVEGISQGLDLRGGVSAVYEAQDEGQSDFASLLSGTMAVLRNRLTNQGFTEATVTQQGTNRIRIEIPDVDDPNEILNIIGQPAHLEFKTADGETIMDGSAVVSAEMGYLDGQPVVQFTLNDEGAAAFATATAENVGSTISIELDGEVISAPTVNQAITGGQGYIEGNFTAESAQQLAMLIQSGALPLDIEQIEVRTISATLGEDALSTSMTAAVIGVLLVIVFMLVIYRLPGVMASLALLIYILIDLFLLAVIPGVQLTLPGIAGIVLSIGMAVDANVIIFTRIKEEIGLGKTVKSAIKTGFAKALSAIIDGNVTTLIAAAVLYWRGSGTVKGFATTLAIGIVLSMFTALFVTKFVLNALYDLGFTDKKFYGTKKEKKAINFLGKRNVCFIISLVMIGAGVAGMVMNKSSIGGAFNYGLDFKGGTSTSVTFNEDMSLERISSEVVPVVEGVTKSADTQTQKVAGTTEVIIKTRTLSVEERQALDAALVENFGVDESKIVAESISGAISAEMKSDAIVATVIATIFMLLYIWVRFKNIRFAASAVIALVHDVLVVVACYALAKWSVGSTAIACLLTIVGYSINATIVIFDRIRENLKLQGPRADLKEVVNESITQTFTRSINTSLTTFVMVLVLFVMGVSSIREFALPLMAGIICGTYSSVCLTGALWYVLTTRKGKKAAEKSGK